MNLTSPSRFSLLILAAALAAPGSSSQASSVGMTINTGGSYSFWDSFPSSNFTNDAPDASAGLSSPGLTLASSGIATGGLDRIYDAGALASWTVAGSASYNFTGFELQVKNYQYTTQSLNGLFTPTLNGVAFDNVNVSYVTEGTNTQEIVTWSWSSSLSSAPPSAFSVAFSEPGTHASIDAVAVRAVPEPSGALLLIGGTAMLGLTRRRRA